MNLITPLGAIGSSRLLTSPKSPKRPRAPTTNAIAGKNASSELYAICCARPMQSSAMNSWKLRLSAAIHSARLSRCGALGGRPTCRRSVAVRSVAVDKAEATDLCLGRTLSAAPHQQPHGRADAAGAHEAGAVGGRGDDLELR